MREKSYALLGRRALLLTSLGAVAWLAAGCLVLPVPTNRVGPYSRKDISPAAIDSLAVSQTTREQVLLLLGEPDAWSADGSEYRYHWERVKWDIIWVVAAGNSAEGGDIPIYKNYNLLISFDPAGIVSGREFSTDYQGSEQERQLVHPM